MSELGDFDMKEKKKKKASGLNVPEARRSTVQVKLRLPPDDAEGLDDLAKRWGVTRSGAVVRLMEEYWR